MNICYFTYLKQKWESLYAAFCNFCISPKHEAQKYQNMLETEVVPEIQFISQTYPLKQKLQSLFLHQTTVPLDLE